MSAGVVPTTRNQQERAVAVLGSLIREYDAMDTPVAGGRPGRSESRRATTIGGTGSGIYWDLRKRIGRGIPGNRTGRFAHCHHRPTPQSDDVL